MARITRRNFLAGSAAAAAGVTFWGNQTNLRAQGTGEDIRMAVIGVNGRGTAHMKAFAGKGSRVVALCDADEKVLGRRAGDLEKQNTKVKQFKDFRKLLDDKEVDAIAIATPNHWHSLMTIWACQAGKDVYVEKPISHNIYEGRKCVEAAEKYKRVVMHGTQRRSDRSYPEIWDYIKQGNIGAIQWVKGFCYKPRPSIGKVAGPTPIPPNIDYDLWCGPAPMEPLMRKNLHYDWHWVWPTGNGDIGNQVHEMDLCRWAVGDPQQLPEAVLSVGGRFVVDDDATTPNTLISFYDYKPVPFIFEVRGLPRQAPKDLSTSQGWVMDAFGRIVRIGNWIQCENGYYAGGEGGGWVYDKDGNKVKEFKQNGQGEHQANFIKAVKSRDPKDNKANALTAHLSAALCHMGNISYRCGEGALATEVDAKLKSNAQAAEAFERMKDHLAKNNVDLGKQKIMLGEHLTFDPKAEKFTGAGADKANKLVSRDYRKPYVVPENV
jgi:hypothetical protein